MFIISETGAHAPVKVVVSVSVIAPAAVSADVGE